MQTPLIKENIWPGAKKKSGSHYSLMEPYICWYEEYLRRSVSKYSIFGPFLEKNTLKPLEKLFLWYKRIFPQLWWHCDSRYYWLAVIQLNWQSRAKIINRMAIFFNRLTMNHGSWWHQDFDKRNLRYSTSQPSICGQFRSICYQNMQQYEIFNDQSLNFKCFVTCLIIVLIWYIGIIVVCGEKVYSIISSCLDFVWIVILCLLYTFSDIYSMVDNWLYDYII